MALPRARATTRTASHVARDQSIASWLLPEMPARSPAWRKGWSIDDVIEITGGVLLALVLTALALSVV